MDEIRNEECESCNRSFRNGGWGVSVGVCRGEGVGGEGDGDEAEDLCIELL